MINEEILRKIEQGPAVLIIGQKYLQLDNGEDVFLEKIINKFNNKLTNNKEYNAITSLNVQSNYDNFSAWAENLCKDISVPLWLERISHIPWSHVYTSAIDTIIQSAFITEWRRVQPIYNENYKTTNLRNRHNLHISYLFGCISQIEISKRPPLTLSEKVKRKYTSNILLQKIPELVTPKGVLIIEGYNEEMDWLTVEDLFTTVSRLGNFQTLLFSVTESFLDNELIKELVNTEKLLVFKQSFAEIISLLQSELKLHFNIPDPEDLFARWINIDNNKIKVPPDLINKISKTATIIDDSLFYNTPLKDDEEKLFLFKNFLASTNTSPAWTGYSYGFAFKRTYYDTLKSKVLERLSSNLNKEVPIILFGQTSSGKTTSLGLLAYELSQELKVAVLFIEKRYQKIDEFDIDAFCRWAEENGAKNTVVIWDGMNDPDIYYGLLRKLLTRGRNIILVGSSYYTSKISGGVNNYVESPIELDNQEKVRFVNFIKEIDLILSNILSDINDKNLLAMLYRYLPSSRYSIRSGLRTEFDFFSKLIINGENESLDNTKGTFSELLINAGLIEADEILTFSTIKEIEGDKINLADQLIFSIMVPGQFALSVPFELLLRTIGYEALNSKLFKVLSEVDLISWFEDSEGSIILGPRTALEAKILTNYLGSVKTQIEYIKLLLKDIKSDDFSTFGFESSIEIHFAVELLNNISPNTTEKYINYLYEITEVLRGLREGRLAYHPRLVLKEASFLREIAKKDIETSESSYKLLERAESIVRESLEMLKNFRERTINTYLRIELASILGTRVIEYGDDQRKEDAQETYQLVKEINSYSFASNPENYNALDVLAWTTEYLIKKNILVGNEKIDAEAEMINLFEMAEVEGISEANKSQYLARKLKFYELINQQTLAETTFKELLANGSASGFYIRAKKILIPLEVNKEITNEELVRKSTEVFDYLNLNFNQIKNDGKCLFLLLKSWWIMKAKAPLYAQERQALPFSQTDWQYCHRLVELLLYNGEQYQSATIYYIKAITEFHLGQIKASFETFRFLDTETDFSLYGRRRIMKTYLASSAEGKAKVYSGEVRRSVSYKRDDKIGQLYVSEIKDYIPFILIEFGKRSYQSGEVVDRFHIGFNFRGPIAIPIKS